MCNLHCLTMCYISIQLIIVILFVHSACFYAKSDKSLAIAPSHRSSRKIPFNRMNVRFSHIFGTIFTPAAYDVVHVLNGFMKNMKKESTWFSYVRCAELSDIFILWHNRGTITHAGCYWVLFCWLSWSVRVRFLCRLEFIFGKDSSYKQTHVVSKHNHKHKHMEFY